MTTDFMGLCEERAPSSDWRAASETAACIKYQYLGFFIPFP